MTEDEAKTKWCPFVQRSVAREGGGGITISSRGATYDDDHKKMPRCIASACMAWRGRVNYSNSGYCGLAGQP
jgi:hypothetical protein